MAIQLLSSTEVKYFTGLPHMISSGRLQGDRSLCLRTCSGNSRAVQVTTRQMLRDFPLG